MSGMDVNQLLAQMRAMAAQAENRPVSGIESPEPKPDFSEILKNSVDSVNEAQKAASQLATSFEQGDPNTNLAEVMVALEKASVSYQAITQVRNRLLTAYQEIMKMPI